MERKGFVIAASAHHLVREWQSPKSGKHEPNNVKALLRRASAREGLGDPGEAQLNSDEPGISVAECRSCYPWMRIIHRHSSPCHTTRTVSRHSLPCHTTHCRVKPPIAVSHHSLPCHTTQCGVCVD
eukprot:1146111-Pelagomonas_calceolata.AAC.3